MKSNALVYLSGPITAAHGYSVHENVASALDVFLDCIRRGIPAFCPHLCAMFTPCFEVPYETWMAYDFAMIDRCTHVLMLPRWETSKGAVREQQYAFLRARPVFYELEALVTHLEKAA